MSTTHLGLATLTENQASAEVTFNESMYILDAITQASAIERIFDADNASEAEGNVYLIHGGTPAGGDDWEGYEDTITFFFNDEWRFIAPKEGMMIYVVDEDRWYYYTGAAWQIGPLKTDSISGHLVVPVDGDITIDLRAAQGYTITELSGKTGAGSCDIQLKKNSVSVGTLIDGVGSIGVSTQAETITVVEDDMIELTISDTSNTQDLAFGVKIEL